MTFQQKLDAIMQKNNSLVCIGLDSELSKIPSHLKEKANVVYEFNKAIVDATHDTVCAYKPNSAFYEAYGASGIEQLKMTCDYIKATYPEIPIILDAKRADIGNTNEGYVKYAFDYLGADAITLHPYLGKEAIKPFLDRADIGCIILCRTSNPGAGELQDPIIDGIPMYKLVAQKVANEWNYNHNCLLVTGATYPDELKEIRAIVNEMTLLVPGIGAQGGDVEKTVKAGVNLQKKGIIVSSSRAIIFASGSIDFAEKAKQETLKLQDEINKFRA